MKHKEEEEREISLVQTPRMEEELRTGEKPRLAENDTDILQYHIENSKFLHLIPKRHVEYGKLPVYARWNII